MNTVITKWTECIGKLFCKNGIESSPLEQSYFLYRPIKDQYPDANPQIVKYYIENDFLQASFITFIVKCNDVIYDPASITYEYNRTKLRNAFTNQHTERKITSRLIIIIDIWYKL